MPEVIDAAVQRDIVLLLAAIVVILGTVVSVLFWLLIKEKDARVKRSEALTDLANKNFDGLEEATKTAVGIAQATLDELRRR
ncbi:MAG TPA: hypothetical protein VK845_04855 [Gemmatimonadales bacterium]|nr:hypothetical protein [Gemmatimonadales bacterium]